MKRLIKIGEKIKEFEEIDIFEHVCDNCNWFHDAVHDYINTYTQGSINADCEKLQGFIIDLNGKYEHWPLDRRQTVLLILALIARLKQRLQPL